MARRPPRSRLLLPLRLALLALVVGGLAVGGCDARDASSGAATSAAAAAPSGTDEAPAADELGGPASSGPRLAPEFTLSDLEGEVVRSAELRGKTVVIDFWATWCPPCEFQVPELNTFWQSHAGEGDVVVLGVSVDVESDDLVREWAEKKGVEYRVLVGGEDLARRFGALGFPTLYVLSPEGHIVMEHVGLIEVADLESALSELRAGG